MLHCFSRLFCSLSLNTVFPWESISGLMMSVESHSVYKNYLHFHSFRNTRTVNGQLCQGSNLLGVVLRFCQVTLRYLTWL